MIRNGEEVRLNETEASGGVKPHIVRYMLIISLVLAIVVMSVIWMSGTLSV